ncbi:SKIP/SNW domain-containing protein [Jimgerdemannia flammicorona]|uniref:Pre-mRNA-processing protein 45 n=1 Tax=Jimgerdemannia flammicorona TaxID=994334 RepID=A0A433QCZ4_9FUNG|nr:SKIP/SNW domain-containing protein [Jimgerdemannia flammicorona]
MTGSIYSADTLNHMRRMMSTLVDDVFGTHSGDRGQRRGTAEPIDWVPELDIYNTQNEIIVKANLPGVPKDSLNIETRDENLLILSGESTCPPPELDRNTIVLHERPCGMLLRPQFCLCAERSGATLDSECKFRRAIGLPGNINHDAIKASLVEGCLEVKVPKVEPSGKKIEISKQTESHSTMPPFFPTPIMATALSSVLPKPRHSMPTAQDQQSFDNHFDQLTALRKANQPPPYGKRSGFKPRGPEDFGNGGAFPEIHLAQYPLDMGRKNSSGSTATSGGSLTLEVDAQGNVRYDAIARQGHSDTRIVHSQFKDLVPLHARADVDEDKITEDRPSEEEVTDVMERTRAALEKIVQGKIAAAQPKNVVQGGDKKGPTYIRYTPGQGSQSDAFNSGAKQRIIRMVEMPVDPMDPPKFKHKKIPRGPPSPQDPVLHSPPRRLTAKEQSDWVIPPCISNWKNSKGYTIPLDKRLAADGRGLQEVTINDNFAKFSEALFAADRHAREEVRQRNLMAQKLAQKQKEAEEEKLRLLAQRAREER